MRKEEWSKKFQPTGLASLPIAAAALFHCTCSAWFGGKKDKIKSISSIGAAFTITSALPVETIAQLASLGETTGSGSIFDAVWMQDALVEVFPDVGVKEGATFPSSLGLA
ncbi:hypothetical protein AGABI1DRAFT_95541 [Agaricus bisporus var. burnettii JB137-S8]|uniref:Uncharacterized protein n=1 Tax=Agaricus bisporus var. burnettii (strain JB137-S8 / ATCC MYA-4627 / FGSC 10392) TaxID=597362 RepID=K5XJE5_AGABU|nr:uncharacterized protein AGABI1DRAFT_95541 [Agaricus bisporus var. burnettii JB137-S8]EKM74575.1 hypothetical protein AGABI1DRAFT_95541 [Agaricus bisporus var. burnettii JB137-S8]